MGGRITSPRSMDKEQQPHLHHLSRHDIAALASTAYHGGCHEVLDLSLSFTYACGYTSFFTEHADDVLLCYGTIQLLHRKVCQAWYNPWTLQSGPMVERILKRGLSIFPKLCTDNARETITFYKGLRQVLGAYLIPLIHFDAISLANNYEGLFPPGLGTDAYAECSTAILKLLPHLLPTSNIEDQAQLSAVLNTSCNGYDLMWCVLELFVPGFDPTIPKAQPQWSRNDNILDLTAD
jgi:hypothetical protein